MAKVAIERSQDIVGLKDPEALYLALIETCRILLESIKPELMLAIWKRDIKTE